MVPSTVLREEPDSLFLKYFRIFSESVSHCSGTSLCSLENHQCLPRLPLSPAHWLLPLRYSLVAQTIKNPPAMQETRVLVWGTSGLEKGMATHSSILAWRIPWTEEPGRLQSVGSQRVRSDWGTNAFTLHFHFLRSSKSYNPPSAKLLFLAISPQWYLQSEKRTIPFFKLYDPLCHRKPQRVAFVP